MNFNITDDRRMLSESLRRYLGDRYDAETRNRVAYAAPYHSPEHWQEMAELGFDYYSIGRPHFQPAGLEAVGMNGKSN